MIANAPMHSISPLWLCHLNVFSTSQPYPGCLGLPLPLPCLSLCLCFQVQSSHFVWWEYYLPPRLTWMWMESCTALYSMSDGSCGSPFLPSPMHCYPHPHCCSALLPFSTPSHPPLSLSIVPWDMVLLLKNNIITCVVAHVVMLFFAVTLCYNFLPFSCILPCLCSTISLLPLCSIAQGDPPLLTCLPVILLLIYHSSLASYLITGLSPSLIISLTVVMFSLHSTKFYNLLLR